MMRKNIKLRQSIVRWAIVFAFAMSGGSCKEQLPPYQDPRDVFGVRLYGDYAISTTENAMKSYLTVINTFDETFEAPAVINGSLVITWDSDRSFRKTMRLDASAIYNARGYNPVTGILRLDPGDSVRFGFSWNMIADDGRSLLQLATFVRDPTCPNRNITPEPLRMIFEADVRLYERIEPVIAPRHQFAFVLHRQYVAGRDCGNL